MPTTTPKIGLQKPIPNVDTDWGVTINASLNTLDEAILAPNLLGSGTITIFNDGGGGITISGADATIVDLVAVSGHLTTEIDSDIVTHSSLTSAHHIRYSQKDNDAIIGSDGITVVSGTSTIDIQGFQTEFVSASGSLQSSIDSIDSSVTLQEAYDNGDGIILTTGGKPLDLQGTGELTAVSGTFTGDVGIGTTAPTAELEVVGDIVSKGTSWTSRTSAADNDWYDVTYGNGLFVAIGFTGTGDRVMTSPDGVNWTARTSAADNDWYDVVYGNGLFVAVGETGANNRVMTSPDGITWTIQTSAANNKWRAVTYGEGLFVALSSTGTGNQVMTSPDGITWTSRTTPTTQRSWTGITYGNGLFVAVAQGGTEFKIMTSPDGITWTDRTEPAANGWFSVTYGNGLFVAVSFNGDPNQVMTSPDGITWTSRATPVNNQWLDVTYGNGLFVAVSFNGDPNQVMTSPDGITWTSRTSAADNNWRGVIYGNGMFVAVGHSGVGNRVMTSGKTLINEVSTDNILQGGRDIRGDLDVTGDITGSGTVTAPTGTYADSLTISGVPVSAGVLRFPDGSASAPSISFASTPGAGFYLETPSDIHTVLAGFTYMHLSTGALTVPLTPIHGKAATAASPGYAFFGDSNTGMYNVAADVLGFSAGGTLRVTISGVGDSTDGVVIADNLTVGGDTALSNALFAKSSNGRVGIGTTSPAELLDVGNGGNVAYTTIPNKAIQIGSITNNHEVAFQLAVSEGTNNRRAKLFLDDETGIFGLDMTASTGVTDFQIQKVGSALATFKGNTGFLGIGTTSPSERLHVVGNTLHDGDLTVSGVSAPTLFADTSTERVGIGTTSPATALHVIAASPKIRLEDDDGASTSYFEIRDFSLATAVVQKLSATGSSLIQIAPRPSDGSSNAEVTMFRNTDTTGKKRLQLLRGDDSTTVDIQLATDGGKSYFNSPGANLGIGTDDPSNKLHVVGNSTFEGDLTVTGVAAPTLFVNSSNGLVGMGTSNPQTALHISAAVPILRLTDSDGAGKFELRDINPNQATITKSAATGNASIIDIDPKPEDGTSQSAIRLFRSTNTTGAKHLQLFRGDGTGSLDVQLGAGGGNSYFNSPGAALGIGTTSPSEKLHVVGSGIVSGDLDVQGTGAGLTAVTGTFTQGLTIGTGSVVITGDTIKVGGNDLAKGLTWVSRTSAVEGNGWRSVTYGNGLFVAVSNNGSGDRVMTSPDGVTWTTRTNATDIQWGGITYGNGLFVAVATDGHPNQVMTSPDGITWTSRTTPVSNFWQNVAYGNGLFVVVSSSGVTNSVMTSPNGINWTIRTSASDNQWQDVIYGNGLFVAVSVTGSGDRVQTSPDGITWTSRTSPVDKSWNSVTYGNGMFVAVADVGTVNLVMTSPDGINWTSRFSAADNNWRSVTYGNGLFVATATSGSSNRVMTSPDGITWTTRTSAADNFWEGATYGNGVFVAVSFVGTNRVMTSGKTELNVTSTSNIFQGGLELRADLGVSGTLNFPNLPTSSGSLAGGDLWVDVADNYALRVTPA